MLRTITRALTHCIFTCVLMLQSITALSAFNYEVYTGTFDVLPEFGDLTAIETGSSDTVSLGVTTQTENFAAVFTHQITVTTAANYIFQLTSDDGSRLYVNGALIVDNDGLHGAKSEEGQIFLNPGSYDLRVEYFEQSGDEILAVEYKTAGSTFAEVPANGVLVASTVSPSDGGAGTGSFIYEVYDGDFDQLPDFTQLTPIDTGTSNEISTNVTDQTETFALVFTNQITISTAGNYTFQLSSDDGSKLYLNNAIIVDHDGLHGLSSKEGQVYLNPGNYDLRVEYFEKSGGEILRVKYSAAGGAYRQIPAGGVLTSTVVEPNDNTDVPGTFNYQVYDGTFDALPDFSSLTPIDTGTNDKISLAITTQTETFATVFTNQITVTTAANYIFQLTSDDGSRLYVNGALIVDNDGLHGTASKEGQIFLNPGSYDLRVEFFENSGDEVLFVAYKTAGGDYTEIPADGNLVASTVAPTDGTAGSGSFSYEVYDGDFDQLPDFSLLTPIDTGTSDEITLNVTNETDTFALVFKKQITVSESANYSFQLSSDDGSRLFINNTLIVDHDGLHGDSIKTAQVFLNPGTYELRVEYFEKIGGESLAVRYTTQSGVFSEIPQDGVLSPTAVTPNGAVVTADFAFEVYDGEFTEMPDFTQLTPIDTGNIDSITLDVTDESETFGLVFRNTLLISAAANYEFRLLSDDGSMLYINDQLVVDNDGLHGPESVTGSVFLSPGTYDFRAEFFENSGGQSFTVYYRVEGGTFTPVPGNGHLTGMLLPKAEAGEWGDVIEWPHIAISAANLPDGRVLTWSSTETNAFPADREFTHAAVFNPLDSSFITTDNNFHDMFCAGLSMLEDGSIVASGGNPEDRRTSKFDPETLEWVSLADMFDQRWYATNLTLPNNQIFSTFGKAAGNRSEKYDPDTDIWSRLPNSNMQTLLDEHNALINAGGDSQWWAHMAVQPDGKVFQGGPGATFHIFDPVNDAPEQAIGQPTTTGYRMWGNAVSYDLGKVMLIGGSDGTRNPITTKSNVYMVDLNGPAPAVAPGPEMLYARSLSNSITLPNGEILVIGGNQDGLIFNDDTAVYASEIYNPQTNSWREAAGIVIPRTYHSTATLLKDGRVLAAGGGACGGCGVNHLDGQIFSPPYLFNEDGSEATRPTLQDVTALAGASSEITVSASTDTVRFTMIRLAAHTHHLNTDHRFVPVEAVNNGDGTFNLTLEANQNVLIAGYYWLFAINANGTPSLGETIQISRNLPDRDGDGVRDSEDAFPDDPSESSDSDGDGTGDNVDTTPNGTVPVVALPQSPHHSSTILVETSSGADRIWNVNPDNNTVSVSGAQGNLIQEITVGKAPWAIAKAPDQNMILVTNKADGTISVINTATLQVENTILIGQATQPHGIVFSVSGQHYYVVLEATALVQKCDAVTHAVVASIPLSGTPRHLAMTYDDTRLLVSNFITPPVPGESTADVDVDNGAGQVFAIDPSNMTLTNTIAVLHDNRQRSESQGPGLPNYLNAPVVDFNNAYAFVPFKKDNIGTGSMRDNLPLTFDQTVRAGTAALSLSTNLEVGIGIDWDNASMATGAAITGDNRYLLVALETSRELAIYDTIAGFELMRLPTGRAPQGVALSTDGSIAYVHNFMDRSISRFDLTEMIQTRLPASNVLSSIPVVTNETLNSIIFTGKQLFYDAADDRLAADNYMSCASCHNEGSHDGRVWDFSSLGEGLRNTIPLNGRAGTGHGFLHWSANFDELQDFEAQIRALAGGTGLMANAEFNSGTTSQPLGDPKAGLSTDLDALAAYVSSLATFAPSPYAPDHVLSTEAQLGKQVFIDNNCASCHGGPNFTLSGDASNLTDVGTLKTVSGTRLFGLLNGLDIPTLRDVWSTAPYLHDGSAQTLQDAVNAHSSSVVNLTAQEVEQVTQYLLQIGDGPAVQ